VITKPTGGLEEICRPWKKQLPYFTSQNIDVDDRNYYLSNYTHTHTHTHTHKLLKAIEKETKLKKFFSFQKAFPDLKIVKFCMINFGY
jgi:hypothetical protein